MGPARQERRSSEGGGVFASGTALGVGGSGARRIVIGDFNNDGAPDIAVTDILSDQVSVLLGNGAGSLAPAPGSPYSVSPSSFPFGIAAADLSGDGTLDVVTSNDGTPDIARLFGAGNGSLATPAVFPAGDTSTDIRLVDVTGDGVRDAVVPGGPVGAVRVLPGLGGGSFGPARAFPARANPASIDASDVDLDGDLDLVTTNGIGGGDVSVLINDGAGSFAPPLQIVVDPQGTEALARDLNGDKLPDLVVISMFNSKLFVLLAN
jgi:hypothetical protein